MRLFLWCYVCFAAVAIGVTFASLLLFWMLWFSAFFSPGFIYYVAISVNSCNEAFAELCLFALYLFSLLFLVANWHGFQQELKSL
jgi:hypothetical protein